MRIFPTPPYYNEPELLDSLDDVSAHDLETTLRDIRRANIFGLGTWVVKHHVGELLRDFPRGAPLRVLDLATGSADIPEELCRMSEREGFDISVVATDIGYPILDVARERIDKAGFGDRVAFVVCDAVQPPFEEGSFDMVICSLAFHHLNLGQAQRALEQMSRMSRVGFVVNDIYRSQGAWYMAWLLARVTTNNRLTRHDATASVSRAYTPRELARLARRVGVSARIYKHPFWRVALVGRGQGSP